MASVITFGELMLRLSPPGYQRFLQAEGFEATYGGAEANTAVALAGLGIPVAFVTKLPAHEIGQAALNSLRRYGVDTRFVVRGGDRLGIYYLEKGASQRASKVIYDRAYSAMVEARERDFDWEAILEGAKWFHFTGITPALGENPAKICTQACMAAERQGITVSCDINYRSKLWTKEQAGAVMEGLMPYVDVCMTNIEQVDDVFGIRSDSMEPFGQKAHADVAKKLKERFGFSVVALTMRTSRSAERQPDFRNAV